MTTWFHTAILATSLAGTLAIGLASAAIYEGASTAAAPKTDRLPIVANSHSNYVTVETRGVGVSILNGIPHRNGKLTSNSKAPKYAPTPKSVLYKPPALPGRRLRFWGPSVPAHGSTSARPSRLRFAEHLRMKTLAFSKTGNTPQKR